MAVVAGVAPQPALQSAILSNISSDGPVGLSVLCAFVEGGEPHLVSFNRDHDRRFVDHSPGDLVQLGSLIAKEGVLVCQISDAFIGEFGKTTLEGSALLACALGLCQSYGIHNVLLTHGVGGAFVGAYVDSSGFHWQPDIGYVLSTPGEGKGDMVFPFLRNDVLVVRSLLSDGPPRVFITSLDESLEAALERAKRVDEQCLSALHDLQFEYLIFLNRAIPIVAVVEMGRRSEHRHVTLHRSLPPSADGRADVPVSVSTPLYILIFSGVDVHLNDDPEDRLGAFLQYMGYQHPRFDIRHADFEVEFFGNQGSVDLPDHVTATYEAAKDTAPIFLQGRDNVGFGAAHLLKWYLDQQGKELEYYIPMQERKLEGSIFKIGFPIVFTEGSFYMITRTGRRDLRKLKLIVEIAWLPADSSRPCRDPSGFPDLERIRGERATPSVAAEGEQEVL